MKNNFIICCSRKCNDFYLLYDGFGTYSLYHENDLNFEFVEDKTPTNLCNEYNDFMIPYKKFKENCTNESLNRILNEITDLIGDAPERQLIYTLQQLFISLRDAEKEKETNLKNVNDAPDEIIKKIRELEKLTGLEDTIFDELTKAEDVNAEIQQRINPILTNEEKAKADLIAKEIDEKGLLTYLDGILNNIHIGKHKNIYRKILMLFKIMRGEASFLSETTAKAESGKSFEDDIVFLLIAPNRYVFEVNDITLASFVRYALINPKYFDRMIIYFGDLGSKKSFDKVEPIFNVVKPLITENKYTYIKSDKNNETDIIEIVLEVDSIGGAYQTVKNSFTEDDDQLISRTLFSTPEDIDINKVLNQTFYLYDARSKQSKAKKDAEEKLNDFGLYLMDKIHIEDNIINPYKDVFFKYCLNSENPIRELKQQMELFNAYCILTKNKCKSEPSGTLFASEEQLKEYMDYINIENALIPYEYDFLNMIISKDKSNELTVLYNENDFYDKEGKQLNYDYIKQIKENEKVYDAEGNILDIELDQILTLRECENSAIELLKNEDIESYEDLSVNDLKNLPVKLNTCYGLRSSGLNHKEKVFFRYTDLKGIYYKYKAYKNIDDVPALLQTLYNKGYLGKYGYKLGKENLYYLTPKCEMLETEFKLEKKYDDYVSEYFANTGYNNF